MTVPTKYVPGYDFSAYQAGLPNKPLPADRVDIELANIANALGGAIDAIADIKITSDPPTPGLAALIEAQVAAAVLAALPEWRGPWQAATAYGVADLVSQGGSSYICVVAHTSGTFATDLAAVKWQIYAAQGATGGGDMLKADNLSGLANTTTAQTNLGGTVIGRGVFTAADATAAQTAIGGTTVGRAVLAAADATAAQTAIGGTAVGRAVLAAADAAAGRTALGITAAGTAPMFGIRAWGRVTPGGVLSFGGNIASVVKSGTLYQFTFATALPTANYLVMAEDASGTIAVPAVPYPAIGFTPESGSFSTTGFTIRSNISSGAPGMQFQFVVIG